MHSLVHWVLFARVTVKITAHCWNSSDMFHRSRMPKLANTQQTMHAKTCIRQQCLVFVGIHVSVECCCSLSQNKKNWSNSQHCEVERSGACWSACNIMCSEHIISLHSDLNRASFEICREWQSWCLQSKCAVGCVSQEQNQTSKHHYRQLHRRLELSSVLSENTENTSGTSS